MSRKTARNIETEEHRQWRLEQARRALDNIQARRQRGYVNRKAERSGAEPFNQDPHQKEDK